MQIELTLKGEVNEPSLRQILALLQGASRPQAPAPAPAHHAAPATPEAPPADHRAQLLAVAREAVDLIGSTAAIEAVRSVCGGVSRLSEVPDNKVQAAIAAIRQAQERLQ